MIYLYDLFIDLCSDKIRVVSWLWLGVVLCWGCGGAVARTGVVAFPLGDSDPQYLVMSCLMPVVKRRIPIVQTV